MQKKTIKSLHSIYCLGRGGLETWLMNLIRQKSDEVQIDFAVGGMWGGYEEEAIKYGSRFFCNLPPNRFIKRLQIAKILPRSHFLEKILAENKYDVFHVHGEEFMGDSAKIAAAAGVPVRVVHCHGSSLARGKKNTEMILRNIRFKTLDRARILKYATDIVACSNDAGRFLLGEQWQSDARCGPLYCGVPLNRFRETACEWTRPSYRRAIGIPDNAIVIGHIGNMGPTPIKNHLFIIEIFAELAKRNPRYYLYLAGHGPMQQEIAKLVKEKGLESRVAMPGSCKDVPPLMVHGFDVHILPSLREGLPIVGLEAVAAGLFTVCSDTITSDYTNYFAERVAALSLKSSRSVWADHIEAAVARRVPVEIGCALMARSPFSIESSFKNLENLYRRRLNITL